MNYNALADALDQLSRYRPLTEEESKRLEHCLRDRKRSKRGHEGATQ